MAKKTTQKKTTSTKKSAPREISRKVPSSQNRAVRHSGVRRRPPQHNGCRNGEGYDSQVEAAVLIAMVAACGKWYGG